MNFANAMRNNSNTKFTENGGFAYENTAQGALVDLFSQIGALRPRSEQEIRSKFASAYAEDALLATKMLFYCGNIRGGLGERRTFRICLKWLAEKHPNVAIKNLDLVPYFNRYDSLFELIGTDVEEAMWRFIGETLIRDMNAVKIAQETGKYAPISLLAKWMPSENASSDATRKLARTAMKHLGMTAKRYRVMLSVLRKNLNIVERLMSAQEWDKIAYEAVPSYAMKNYRNAFRTHDEDRFGNYLDSLQKGEVKINASTLYPYDLVHQYMEQGGYYWHSRLTEDRVIEAQWKALPNYVEGENNFIVMADVSGSMTGRPMETSVGLATYFAQRNKGDYHNMYMTFTDRPHFIALNEGASLADNVAKVMRTDVGYNTNLEAAFQYILDTAIRNRVSAEEMPKALIVISDMEIDRYMRPGYNWSFVDVFKQKFANAGYELPQLVMWNVEARNDTVLGHGDNIVFVSGQSVSAFGALCGAIGGKTAYDFMCEVLNAPMYDAVAI